MNFAFKDHWGYIHILEDDQTFVNLFMKADDWGEFDYAPETEYAAAYERAKTEKSPSACKAFILVWTNDISVSDEGLHDISPDVTFYRRAEVPA